MHNRFKILVLVSFLIGFVCTFNSFQEVCGQDLTNGKPQDQEKIIDVSRWSTEQRHEQTKTLANVLDSEGLPPAVYVASKFEDFDVVLFGEIHEVKENCDFVASLIKPLHESGVRILFSEFIPTRFNKQIAKITIAETYNEQAVIEVFRQRPSPTWGYQEYVDIVNAVWEFNQTLRSDQARFEIIGIEDDWNESALMNAKPEERFKIISHRESHMTDVIRQESLERSQKALVHIGYAHTVQHGIRVAAELEKTHAGKVFQIVAHHEFSGSREAGAMTKCLESAVEHSKFDTVGFDIENTRFDKLRDSKSFAFKMLGNTSTLENLARGYVFLKPVSELTSVSWIEGFVTEATFQEALDIAKKKKWIAEDPGSALELDKMIADRFRERNSIEKK